MVLNEIDEGTLDKIRQMEDSELCDKGSMNDKYFSENKTRSGSGFDFSSLIANEQFEINLQRFIESRLVLGVSPTGTKKLKDLE